MHNPLRLKQNYSIAQCCKPSPPAEITGYYSHDNTLRVHRRDCPNLAKAEPERLVPLDWDDIVEAKEDLIPGPDFAGLDDTDFAILAHHERVGPDYSLVVARELNIPKDDAFNRHTKLRDLDLIERVEPRIIQYRKGIVDGKWIKHRNHTYYALTEQGRAYLDLWRGRSGTTR